MGGAVIAMGGGHTRVTRAAWLAGLKIAGKPLTGASLTPFMDVWVRVIAVRPATAVVPKAIEVFIETRTCLVVASGEHKKGKCV